MNKFLQSAKKLILRNGSACVFWKQTGAEIYNVETGKAQPVKTQYNVLMFPRQVVANQYNMPNLIGKEVVQFYLANSDLGFTPSINDDVTYNSKTYKVVSYQEHVAQGVIVLYRIVCIKS